MSAAQHGAEHGAKHGAEAAGSSFYAGMRILPRAQRQAMYDVYAFCRAVDDIADGDAHVEDPQGALARWRADIAAIYNGEDAGQAAYLKPHIEAYGLKRADFWAVIDGMAMDLNGPIQAPSRDALDLYCDRVASAVGRLSTPIFGLAPQAGADLAHHLGRALQLTNILRDLDEDCARGRLYLPREDLAAAHIETTSPVAALNAPQLDAACAPLAQAARAHYSQAKAIMDAQPQKTVRAPRLMAYAYEDVLRRVMARGFAPPRRRVGVRKGRLAFRALLAMLA